MTMRFGRRSRLAVVAGAGVLSLAVAGAAHAQVIYEPLQYQYTVPTTGDHFYYGGSDPRVFDFAADNSVRYHQSPVSGQPFTGGNVKGDFLPAVPRRAIYSDRLPYHNLANRGYTVSDAQNEASANVPRYFKKADLLRAAVPTEDGWVVPAQARPIPDPKAARRPMSPAVGSTPEPGLILIIPSRPAAPKSPPTVVAAATERQK